MIFPPLSTQCQSSSYLIGPKKLWWRMRTTSSKVYIMLFFACMFVFSSSKAKTTYDVERLNCRNHLICNSSVRSLYSKYLTLIVIVFLSVRTDNNVNSSIVQVREQVKTSFVRPPFRLGARSRFSGTGTCLNRAFCRCPFLSTGTGVNRILSVPAFFPHASVRYSKQNGRR